MTTDTGRAWRVEEIEVVQRALLNTALDESAPAGTRIETWNRLLELEQARDELVG